MHHEGSFLRLLHFLALGAGVIGVKDEPIVFYRLEQNHPRIGHALCING